MSVECGFKMGPLVLLVVSVYFYITDSINILDVFFILLGYIISCEMS